MKWSFGGMSLPGLPVRDAQAYPYLHISWLTDSFAYLYAVDRLGYVDAAESAHGLHYLGEGGEMEAMHFIHWVVALTETAAQALQGTYPGISTGRWLQVNESYGLGIPMDGGPYWTNATLYDENGAVFLEKSAPVPQRSFCRRSYLAGMGPGLMGKALPFPIRRPVAYLYNGVRLPKLPEWNREMYPYAVIWKKSTAIVVNPIRYGLVVSSEPIYWVDAYSDYLRVISAANTITFEANVYADTPNSAAWVESSRNEDHVGSVSEGYDALWANHDVYVCTYSMLTNTYTVTDSLHMAASEPIPIYE